MAETASEWRSVRDARFRALRFDEKGTLYVAAISGRPRSGGATVSTENLERPPPDPSRAPVPSHRAILVVVRLDRL